MSIDDSICFDKLKVAEKFNSFYTTVASKLVEKLPNCIATFGKSFVFNFYCSKGVKPNSYSLSIVDESQVFKILNNLSPKKATGLDSIPSRFIRDSASIIAHPLAHIINLSIIQGVVPDDLKLARVVPLFKKNDKTDVGNYRPVSILSVISKVLERVVYNQLEGYLSDKNLLFDYQSGFRRKFSTETCLIHLTDFIRFQMDRSNLVGMLLLDLQKAFDTVDHSILLMKLEALGLNNSAVSWFASYLTDRHQLVDVSGTFSSSAPISCGVPQGSILGPLLFLVYVNDMSAVVKHKLLLYADDSAILVTGKNKESIENMLSSELDRVSDWLICNKLSLHLGKTESILFGSKVKVKSLPGLSVKCKGHYIQPKESVKYLGATIDQSLSFESMALSVIQKVNSRLKFLYRKKEFLTAHTKKLLVMAIAQCHMDYASTIWFHSITQALRNKLQVTQNKLIRFVLNLDSRAHVGKEQFAHVNWLPVSKRVDFKTLCHVFNVHNNEAPKYLNDGFVHVESTHSHNTRFRVKSNSADIFSTCTFKDSGRFSVPRVKGPGTKSFLYRGCSLWNKLPQHLRECDSYESFKPKARDYLFNL